jgi:hypothetical protein
MLWARVLADGVVVIHALFVGFVVVGMMAIVAGLVLGWGWVRNARFRALHLAAIVVVALQSMVGVICPLTILENHLRRLSGQEAYPGAFVGYWAHRLIFVRAEPWAFTLAYVLFAAAVLAAFVLGPPRRASRAPSDRPAPTPSTREEERTSHR